MDIDVVGVVILSDRHNADHFGCNAGIEHRKLSVHGQIEGVVRRDESGPRPSAASNRPLSLLRIGIYFSTSPLV